MSDRGGDTPRDVAARRMNMGTRGVNSTAWPSSVGPASEAAAGMMAPAQQQLQLPASGPQLPSRPMMGGGMPQGGAVPTPTPRPNPNAMQMGDASVMEAILGGQGGFPSAPAAPSAVPMSPDTAATQQPGADATQQSAGGGFDPTSLIAGVTALGGTAAVATLLMRYRMGDPAAAQEIAKVGLTPEVLGTAMQAFQNMQGGMQSGPPIIDGEVIPDPKQLGGPQRQLPAPQRQLSDQRDSSAQSDTESKKGDRPSSQSRKQPGSKSKNPDDDMVRRVLESGSGTKVPRARPKPKVKAK